MTVPIDLSPTVLEGIRRADELQDCAGVLREAYGPRARTEALKRAVSAWSRGDLGAKQFWVEVSDQFLVEKFRSL